MALLRIKHRNLIPDNSAFDARGRVDRRYVVELKFRKFIMTRFTQPTGGGGGDVVWRCILAASAVATLREKKEMSFGGCIAAYGKYPAYLLHNPLGASKALSAISKALLFNQQTSIKLMRCMTKTPIWAIDERQTPK